jgi:hypothetical protein
MDFSVTLDYLRGRTEETPFPAATPSPPMRHSTSELETIKEAKKHEFPMVPVAESRKRKIDVNIPKKKRSKISVI